MSINRLDRTFRLAFIRREIRTTFKSQAVRTALLTELNTRGPDSEVIVRMVEKIPTTRQAVVQPVQPIPQPAQPATVQPMHAQPATVQPMPAQPAAVQPMPAQPAAVQPMPVQPAAMQPIPAQPAPMQPAQVQPAPAVADGNSEESALEVLDSEDELVQDMTLSQRSEQRLRRQLQVWRDRLSSSSD